MNSVRGQHRGWWLVAALLLCLACWLAPQTAQAQVPDSLTPSPDTAAQADPLPRAPRPPQGLDAGPRASPNGPPKAVSYKGTDSIVVDLGAEALTLYGEGQIDYEGLKMTAEQLRVRWADNLVEAQGRYDSAAGRLVGNPVFEDAQGTYHAEKLVYNLETEKGRITNARTQQEDNYVLGEVIRRNPDETFYVKGGKFTSCDHPEPHFYFRSRRAKVIPNDKLITGLVYPVLEGVPIPVALPFGVFPNTPKQTSGILFPEFGEAQDRGFFLRNMGYYWYVNNYLDVFFRGDLFTQGGWRVEIAPRYKYLSQFDGSLNLQLSRQTFNEATDPDFRLQQTFLIGWNHNQQLSPNARFSASVNAGSSTFLQQNSYNDGQFLENRLNSSISFAKNFPRSGWALNLAATHNQDLVNQRVSLTFPNLTVNRQRFFPFKRRVAVGEQRWYEKIGVNYGLSLQNSVTVPDSVFATPAVLDSFRNGARHTVAISSGFTLLRYITVSPSINYNEYWYLEAVEKTYQETTDSNGAVTGRVITTREPGFAAGRDFNFNLSLNTRLYGVMQTQNPRELAFRHTLIPSLSYTYRPDFGAPFWGFYDSVQTNPEGAQAIYSRFEGGIVGGPGRGESQSLNFSLNNLLEMKYRERPDSAALDSLDPAAADTVKPPFRYVNLLDNFGFSTSYNFAADSLNLAPLAAYARANVLNWVNVNLNLTLNPYHLNGEGVVVNRLSALEGGPIFRLTQLTFALSTNLGNQRLAQVPRLADARQARRARLNPRRTGYALLAPNWSLSPSYNLSYSNPTGQSTLTHSLRLTGNLEPTPNWRITASTGYDFTNGGFSITTFNLVRNLHCWELSLQATPFGERRSYFLGVYIKSPLLNDIRVDKRRDWQDRF